MDIFSNVFAHAVALSALAVVAIHQILKFNFVPTKFANRYPVPTLLVLSAVASIVAAWQSKPLQPQTWTDWLILGATVAVTAAITYRTTIKNWPQLRSTEGEG